MAGWRIGSTSHGGARSGGRRVEVEGSVRYERRGGVRRPGVRTCGRAPGAGRAASVSAGGSARPTSEQGEALLPPSSTVSGSSTSGPGFAAPEQRWSEDTPCRDHVGDEGSHHAVRPCPLRPRPARPRCSPSWRTGPSSAPQGKTRTTVRQLLSHQSGAIGLPEPARILSWDGAGWDDTVAIAAALASAPPAWVAGSQARLPRRDVRMAGRRARTPHLGESLGTFFREEVARPLGLDCRHRDAARASRATWRR